MPKVSNLKLGLQSGTDSTLYATWSFSESTSSSSSATNARAKVGDKVTIKSGSKYYNGVAIPSFVMSRQWYVYEVSGNRAVINRSVDGAYSIMSPINVNNLVVVGSTQTKTTANTLDHYQVDWKYDTGNGVWFSGSSSETKDKNATYSIPSNATRIKCSVKPVSKTYTSNGKTVSYWTGTTVSAYLITSENPPGQLSAPSVEIEKYTLTATIENIEDAKADQVEFEVYKGNTKFASGIKSVVTARAIYTCSVQAGEKYRVRCRAINLVGTSKVYGDWSNYSSELTTIPSAVTNVTLAVESETSLRVSWTGSNTATGYTVEYTTNKNYFDSSSEVSSTSVTVPYAYITGLEQGHEWYFRVKATNDQGESGWSEIVYKIIGTKPEPPTTWSLTNSAIVGDEVILYWVHNTEDGSKQTHAQIELTLNGKAQIIDVDTQDSADNADEEETIYSYRVDLTDCPEGAEILWRVRTRGITFEYSDWSIQRTINVYAPPTAELHLGDDSGILNLFPLNISVTAGPNAQTALSYHVSIISEDTYETQDPTGSTVIVNAGSEVFSRIFNVMSNNFSYDLVPEDITLENNQVYTLTVTVAMNSGLTATASGQFTVSWEELDYEPDAAVDIDMETLCAYITPFCMNNDSELVPNVVLSVFRREFDGTFTEIESNIVNNAAYTVTDPHPSLDYARYRIVSRDLNTSVYNYVDLPGIPVGEPSIVIQWDEEWSKFDYSGEDETEVPPWTGSMLKLKGNVDTSENYEPDTSLVKYTGRKRPVSYYGTQKGVKGSWSADIPKSDTETIYALRRLAAWSGDVYVREPSGNGYPANIKVSLSFKHNDPVVPVSLEVERVEGDA